MKRRAKILLLSGNSLCHNPRVMKEALALGRAGYAVAVLGAWLDPAFKARDMALIERAPFAFIPVLDLTMPGLGDRATHAVARARTKIAHVVHRMTGRESARQLGIAAGALARRACSIAADLCIAHSEAGLHAARLLRHAGRAVAVDMEDWFSEDLPAQARRTRPLQLLRGLERDVLRGGAYGSCPSAAMSRALAEAYGCAPPAVVYNTFCWSDRAACNGAARDPRGSVPSIHWVSTTLGPGRGLEELLDALTLVGRPTEIHLRGRPVPGFAAQLAARLANQHHSLVLHDLVSNDQLLPRIATHDIGFAGETAQSRNSDLTVSNKILHYLLAGLAVVASDTTGQREVAAQAPDAVRLYRSGDVRGLAAALDALLASPARLRAAKATALAAAHRVFCWERQEATLLAAVERALACSVEETRMEAAPPCPAC
jgi:glycosyltransferase involved in cell wall biosynthesis